MERIPTADPSQQHIQNKHVHYDDDDDEDDEDDDLHVNMSTIIVGLAFIVVGFILYSYSAHLVNNCSQECKSCFFQIPQRCPSPTLNDCMAVCGGKNSGYFRLAGFLIFGIGVIICLYKWLIAFLKCCIYCFCWNKRSGAACTSCC